MNDATTPSANSPRRAVVLTSGGLDSTTVLAIAAEQGFEPLALSFRYGQRHDVELERAAEIVAARGIREHLVLPLPFADIGGSVLLGEGQIPPEPRAGAGSGAIPSTYVPARNTVFLALALAVAEARQIRDIFIGVNALDYSGYPDCRPEFLEAFRQMADLGTAAAVEGAEKATPRVPYWRLHAPLADLTKAQIIARGCELGVDYARTVSCYDADREGRACGGCEACGLRRRGFAEAGVPDPTRYRS